MPTNSLKDLYVSRKKTFEIILTVLKDKLKVNHECRLWFENVLVRDEMLTKTIETANVKYGSKMFVEEKLENDRWPSDQKMIKKVLSNNKIYKKTKGCFNIGNTCYMNAVL